MRLAAFLGAAPGEFIAVVLVEKVRAADLDHGALHRCLDAYSWI
ncbi:MULTISPECIES: hypothetical protein [Mycobacteriales]|nr:MULTISPECIES: hypothetical protein [Mycobacteriales]